MSYVVFWLDGDSPNAKSFQSHELTNALQHAECLRKRQRNQETVSHITISSEDPNHTGKNGVDVTGPDYNWRKRRST